MSLTRKMDLKGGQSWPEKTPHLDRGRRLNPWLVQSLFIATDAAGSLLHWETCLKWLSSKCALAGAQGPRVHVEIWHLSVRSRQPKSLLGPSASTVGHRHHLPVAFVYIWSLLLESILKQQPLRKVHLQQWSFSMKVSEKRLGYFRLSYTRRACRGRVVFLEGQT